MPLTRRHFLGLSAALPWALSARASTSIPVGLELYSVRGELKKDPEATVRAVAQMGYQVVEFYSPYFDWSESQTKRMRKLLDDLGIRCLSTHNSEAYFSAQNLPRTRDMNLVLGSKYVVQASTDEKTSLDQWKPVADRLNSAAEKLEPAGLKVGYHNHQARRLELLGGRVQPVGNRLPLVQTGLLVGGCLHDVLASQNQIHIARTREILCTKISFAVMRRQTPDPQIIQQLPHPFRLALAPIKVGRIEFHDLVSHLRDGAHGGFRILLQFTSNRIQFQANRN